MIADSAEINIMPNLSKDVNMSQQFATRVDDELGNRFKDLTKRLGTTPSDALRIFIASFDQSMGFPFDVRIHAKTAPFVSEAEADEFVEQASSEMLDEAR